MHDMAVRRPLHFVFDDEATLTKFDQTCRVLGDTGGQDVGKVEGKAGRPPRAQQFNQNVGLGDAP